MSNEVSLWFWLFAFLLGQSGALEQNGTLISDDGTNVYLDALKKHPWQSDKGYAEVRKGAFLFWWLYFADGTPKEAHKKPLIIWVQGGPGLAATGLANFAELGPFNMKLEPRNHTWVKGRNVLLIDHPVGTGFSYTRNDDTNLYAKSDRQVALDLFRAIKGFLKVHPEYEKANTYITSQSYGGKIAPRLAYIIHRAIKGGYIHIKLKGVGIGSGWVDPRESSLVLPTYLYHTGLIDGKIYNITSNKVKEMAKLISDEKYRNATLMDSEIFTKYQGHNIINSFINIAQPDVYIGLEKLDKTINKYVKPTLSMVNQSLVWTYQSNKAFDSLSRNLMLPSFKFVERLLNETNIKVVVYNGNMDATCSMAGAVNWVHKLRWSGAEEFKNKVRTKLGGKMNGFYKSVDTLSLWWVFRAGHWVPEDNPEAMEQILNFMISSQCE